MAANAARFENRRDLRLKESIVRRCDGAQRYDDDEDNRCVTGHEWEPLGTELLPHYITAPIHRSHARFTLATSSLCDVAIALGIGGDQLPAIFADIKSCVSCVPVVDFVHFIDRIKVAD